MEFWIATTNKGKLSEFKTLLTVAFGTNVQVHSTNELPVFFPPPENGTSYLENARIKTKAVKAVKPEAWVIGDDSGIEVKGLGGNIPGIHSARYAGPKASDGENRAKLIKMMQLKGVSDRTACFKCCLIAYSPDGKEYIINTELHGVIASKESGQMGFGYDSIFIPINETKSLAELGPAFKNKFSHRALAVKEFAKQALLI